MTQLCERTAKSVNYRRFRWFQNTIQYQTRFLKMMYACSLQTDTDLLLSLQQKVTLCIHRCNTPSYCTNSFIKQLLHRLRVMGVDVQQALEQLSICTFPLLLMMIPPLADAAALLAEVQHLSLPDPVLCHAAQLWDAACSTACQIVSIRHSCRGKLTHLLSAFNDGCRHIGQCSTVDSKAGHGISWTEHTSRSSAALYAAACRGADTINAQACTVSLTCAEMACTPQFPQGEPECMRMNTINRAYARHLPSQPKKG